MRKFVKAIALCLAMLICIGTPVSVSAAEVDNATINQDALGSITVFKYDWTNAVKDGVWNQDSFISTGWQESYVEEVLGGSVREGDANGDSDHSLGNGETSYGYALKGVEFSYLRVADIVTFTESANDAHPEFNKTMVLYGFDKTDAALLLTAIGLADGAGRYEAADNTGKLDSANYYYTSDTLNKSLVNVLSANATTVKDALESYMATNGGTAIPLTNEHGKTSAKDLPIGLYLLVETKVPEMVTSTTNPFFVSLPMTTVDGDENSASPEGGTEWNYDVTIYPKNETGIPTLEKTVRESQTDTGKNNGSDSITDGYDHNATGSAGDAMQYQFISTLPTITSNATSLSVYNFYDSICEGLTYNKNAGVKLEFFTDKGCTDKVASWDMDSGKFTVTYSDDDHHMTVDITKVGLDEINGSSANANGAIYTGYSNYTLRVTYSATINSDASFIYGDNGNDNKVVLTWKRTSSDYYDTLIDDAHVYSFGINLTKQFSDVDGETANDTNLFKKVKFKIKNKTDGYWLVAEYSETEGVYYVTGHTDKEKDATIFRPVTVDGKPGHIVVKGCEDDEYIITEIATASGYTLLKDDITVTISADTDKARVCDIYAKDVLGVLQNNPHYAFDGGLDLKLANIPQKQLAHNFLTGSAKVDGNKVTMIEDNGSANSEAPLTVVNTAGFDLPQTGDRGTWMYSVVGVLLMVASIGAAIIVLRKKDY